MTRTEIIPEVVKAVAAVDGVEVGEVPPLRDYVDPEILSKLTEQDREGEGRISFQYSDHQITVTQDAQVFVDGHLHATDKTAN